MTTQIDVLNNLDTARPKRPWESEPDELRMISDRFEQAWPEDVLEWALKTFGSKVAMATGFGPSGVTLMHMLSRVDRSATVFYLDTDLLFPQTYDLKRRLADRLGLTFTRVHSGISLQEQARLEGPDLWRTDPDRCCYVRKVLPLRRFLATREAWITGIRRDQSPTRVKIDIVHRDAAHNLVKINPLAGWSDRQIWDYIELNDLPYNPLHDRGYPSLGCVPCTQAVAKDDDPRAGRWKGHDKVECGIHVQKDLHILEDRTEPDDSHVHGGVSGREDLHVRQLGTRYRRSA